MLGTGGIGYLLVDVLDHAHDKRTVTVSTCTPNDTKNCECGNQSIRTCASDGFQLESLQLRSGPRHVRRPSLVRSSASWQPLHHARCWGATRHRRVAKSNNASLLRKWMRTASRIQKPSRASPGRTATVLTRCGATHLLIDCDSQGLGECALVSRDIEFQDEVKLAADRRSSPTGMFQSKLVVTCCGTGGPDSRRGSGEELSSDRGVPRVPVLTTRVHAPSVLLGRAVAQRSRIATSGARPRSTHAPRSPRF